MSAGANPDRAPEPRIRRLHTLYDLLVALSRAEALQDVYEAAVKSLLEATSADRVAILVFDDDGVARFKAWHGLSIDYRNAVTGHTPWPRETRNAQPILIPDVGRDPSLSGFRDLLAREGIRSLAFLPLALEGGLLGKFVLYYTEPHECSSEELAVAQAIGAHVALATSHKRIQLACERSEERLKAILDNSPAIVFLKDAEGRYLMTNRRFEELFRVAGSSILGQTDYDLFPAEVADRFRENDRQVLATGMPLTVEEEVPQDDGIHTYISAKFPLGSPHGTPAMVCGIATDVTDRKKLESDTLHLAAIVESSDDAIMSKDLNGIITSWNQGAERLFGYTAAEAIGQPVKLLSPSELLNDMPDILSKIRSGQRVDHYETRRRAKNGEILDVSLTISPIRDASGGIVGASKIARDITFKKHAEAERTLLLAREHEARQMAEFAQAELKRSNQELRRANDDLETFAYSASHDLQEPLRTVGLCAQLLDRNTAGRLQSEDQDLLATILHASERMTALIGDLLVYTKATKYPAGPAAPVDSAAVLAGTLENLRSQMEQTGATVTSEHLPLLAMHESRLAVLFQNLVSNALKYCRETPRVHISAAELDGSWVISVADNGIGIDQHYADHIFGIFKRLHGRDAYEGSGVGLAICQRIVGQYGGRIWLEKSVPGAGSTFCFSIPSTAARA